MALHPEQRKRHFPEEAPVAWDPIRRDLEENEDWYRDLVEHSQDLLCVHDLEGRFLSVNPAKQAIAVGASFVARTSASNPNHVLATMEAAMDHEGFSFVHCLSECVEFYEGAFDSANPRKGGVFNEVPKSHDVTDEMAAYKLASADFPGNFGVLYQVKKPTKNARENEIVQSLHSKFAGQKDWQILQ